MKALILSCGGSPEPLKFCIADFEPDFTYFLCSSDSVDIAVNISKECNIDDNQFAVKVVSNHESLEDSFAKSREIIKELQKQYDNIHVDFTGGTKPMVSGLVLAAIGEECTYSYVGSKDFQGRDKEGLGVVQNGFESIKDQRDPYDVFAVMEFNRGMDFFNRYQFEAARVNFKEAKGKLESENLIELVEIYLELVDIYDRWDKFKHKKSKKVSINKHLKFILNKINSSYKVKEYLNEYYPNFISQIELNIKFLDVKIPDKGRIKPENVQYYLPDLLNNAYRRIEEGKYDDAVARLYRSIELIAQVSLSNENVINQNSLESNAEFFINISDIESKNDLKVDEVLSTFPEYCISKKFGKNTFGIGSKSSYELLQALGSEFAMDYLNDEEIKTNITSRNKSILAHGLQPIDKDKAVELYSQVLKYAKRALPDLVEYMDMADFPKFE